MAYLSFFGFSFINIFLKDYKYNSILKNINKLNSHHLGAASLLSSS